MASSPTRRLFSSSSSQRDSSPSASSSAPIAIALSTFSRFGALVNREQSRSPSSGGDSRHKGRPISPGSTSPIRDVDTLLGLHTTTSRDSSGGASTGGAGPGISGQRSWSSLGNNMPTTTPQEETTSPYESLILPVSMARPSSTEPDEAGPSTPTFGPLSRTTSAPVSASPISSPSKRPRLRARAETTNTPPARFVPLPSPIPIPPNRSAHTTAPPSLQNHIYSGLLNGTLSDVHVGAFSNLYALHHIILDQSGFFRTMFSSGFSEEREAGHRPEKGEYVHIDLERPMSRAAFEFCLANLYGGGPNLVAPSWAKATQEHPLTELFEELWVEVHEGVLKARSVEESERSWEEVERDPATQKADPKFLLSALATASYLEIPSAQAKALEMITSTITPWTIGQYLNYALGDEMGLTVNLDSTPLRGLESVGVPYNPPARVRSRNATQDSIRSYAPSVLSTIASVSEADTDNAHSFDDHTPEHDATIFTGVEGERVGQACACWLSKWSSEVLAVEEWLESHPERASSIQPSEGGSGEGSSQPPLRVWSVRKGGLSSSWVRGIITSDSFFLGSSVTRSERAPADGGTGPDGEFERYCFAKRVVEFRRREKLAMVHEAEEKLRNRKGKGKARAVSRRASEDAGAGIALSTAEGVEALSLEDLDTEDEEDSSGDDSARKCGDNTMEPAGDLFCLEDPDEKEYSTLFATGIHYSHFTIQQLRLIATDISPTTNRPYVTQSLIERALWLSQDFQSRIPMSPSPFSTISHSAYAGTGQTRFSPDTIDDTRTELGFATTINPSLDPLNYPDSSRPFFLVPTDDTCRLNEGPIEPPGEKKLLSLPSGPESFFGLGLETREGVTMGPSPGVFGLADEIQLARRFVQFEPCRFSAEFWGVGDLREKQRLYSQTVFLGGSYYNLYLQKIQRKGVQLGIYLHRQNPLEPFPTPSAPPLRPSSTSQFPPQARSADPVAGEPLPSALAPYLDRRRAISAFFSIWCPNQLGSSLTKFSSGPDSFTINQSWGWKSSSLRSEEYLGATSFPDRDSPENLAGRFNSLRVTLLFGLI